MKKKKTCRNLGRAEAGLRKRAIAIPKQQHNHEPHHSKLGRDGIGEGYRVLVGIWKKEGEKGEETGRVPNFGDEAVVVGSLLLRVRRARCAYLPRPHPSLKSTWMLPRPNITNVRVRIRVST